MPLSDGISTTHTTINYTHYNPVLYHSRDKVQELQSLMCILPLEFTLGSAVPILHLTTSDCSVQCMNVRMTRNTQPTVQWHSRAVAPTMMTENATVKLTKMLLSLQCRTGTNWLITEQSKHYATGLCILYIPTVQHKWWNHWNMNWSQVKAKVGDDEEVEQSTNSGQAGIVGVISTLEHTRVLVAGRSCCLSADTGR